MHAMGGREGVIDTACKTSETGQLGDLRLVEASDDIFWHGKMWEHTVDGCEIRITKHFCRVVVALLN